ncbi:hypothetical protein H311_01958, partial [Anncaliia algerae PRA109]
MKFSDEFKKSFYIVNCNMKSIHTKLHKIVSKQIDPNDPTPLNKYEIQNYAYYGFDDKSLRPGMWKIFLYHFSDNKFKSELFYKDRRNSYKQYKLQAIKSKEVNCFVDDVIVEDVNRTFLFPDEQRSSCKFLDSKFVNDEKCLSHREIIKEILLVFKVTNPA